MPSSLHQYICQFPEDSSTPPYGEAPKLKWALHFYTFAKKDSVRQGISLSCFIVSYKQPKYELEAITQWSQRDHKSRKEAKMWSQGHLTLCILGKPEKCSYNSPRTECRPCSYYSCIEWGPISFFWTFAHEKFDHSIRAYFKTIPSGEYYIYSIFAVKGAWHLCS